MPLRIVTVHEGNIRERTLTAPELARCMSARRFTGQCSECKNVKTCALPEAAHGRAELARRKVGNLAKQLSVALGALFAAEADAARAVITKGGERVED